MYIPIYFLLGIMLLCVLYFIVYYIKNSIFGTDSFGTSVMDTELSVSSELRRNYGSEPNFPWIIEPEKIQ
jgi:hypothetical protein